MAAFTYGTLETVREALDQHWTMARICLHFAPRYTRDELVEAIDALRRHVVITHAQQRVNAILALQASGEPLINGNPAPSVARNFPFHTRPTAQF